VVSASILAGIAIIPAQAAKLVEALLEFQKDQSTITVKASKQTSPKNMKMIRRMNAKTQQDRATDGLGPSGVEIEVPPLTDGEDYKSYFKIVPTKGCASCGKVAHRVDAIYCWNCGTRFPKE
jgi:hypothetical protein